MTDVGYGDATNRILGKKKKKRILGKARNIGYCCGLLSVHPLPLEIPVGIYIET